MRILEAESLSSTNDYLKAFIPSCEDLIVTAKRQTGGRGTKGRSFLSDEGGLYLSQLKFYRDFPASRAFSVMMHAAAAVCRCAEAFGVSPEIKWPNDILVGPDRKKLCGILIESGMCGELLDYTVIGIGINVWNDVSALRIATSLYAETKKIIPVREVRDALIEQLLLPFEPEAYFSHLRFLGEKIRVTEGGKEYFATALRVLEDGRLEIQTQEGLRALSSAEIGILPRRSV